MDSSFIISVLSVLTTILISFQIYNVINFNYEQRKFNKEKRELKNQIDIVSSKLQYINKLINPILLSEAIMLISKLKEVQDFRKLLELKYKNKRKVIYIKSDCEDDFHIQVDVYEDTEQYITIFNRYKVNMIDKTITKLNILSNEFDINVLN